MRRRRLGAAGAVEEVGDGDHRGDGCGSSGSSRAIGLEEINEGMDALASGTVVRQVITFDVA